MVSIKIDTIDFKYTIDFKGVKKLAEFKNHNHAFYREGIEIIDNVSAVNAVEHSVIDTRRRKLIKGKNKENQDIVYNYQAYDEEGCSS